LGCFQGDSGDYSVWLAKLHGVVNRWQPSYAPAGCTLSVQSVHGSYWVQIDVTGPVVYQQPQQHAYGYDMQGNVAQGYPSAPFK